MKIRYTPAAFSDRERIIEYLRERSADGARNVAASIHEAVAQLKTIHIAAIGRMIPMCG
jgi:plasmid stabilization system protein ParE